MARAARHGPRARRARSRRRTGPATWAAPSATICCTFRSATSTSQRGFARRRSSSGWKPRKSEPFRRESIMARSRPSAAATRIEVTSLRRDVATDGRRATIAFTDDWKEDAARRDFTINALSADPRTGEVYDYFGGTDDLIARRVRFIGEPLERIAEDHLRILRFFRFHARFGAGAPDADALSRLRRRARTTSWPCRASGSPTNCSSCSPCPILRRPWRSCSITRILRPVLPEIERSRPGAAGCPCGDRGTGRHSLRPASPPCRAPSAGP